MATDHLPVCRHRVVSREKPSGMDLFAEMTSFPIMLLGLRPERRRNDAA
jgi:hypothetical protein